MRYVDFRDVILEELRQNPAGLTWVELKERLDLPHEFPCLTGLLKKYLMMMVLKKGFRRDPAFGGMAVRLEIRTGTSPVPTNPILSETSYSTRPNIGQAYGAGGWAVKR